jgi:hypothetical protein
MRFFPVEKREACPLSPHFIRRIRFVAPSDCPIILAASLPASDERKIRDGGSYPQVKERMQTEPAALSSLNTVEETNRQDFVRIQRREP